MPPSFSLNECLRGDEEELGLNAGGSVNLDNKSPNHFEPELTQLLLGNYCSHFTKLF